MTQSGPVKLNALHVRIGAAGRDIVAPLTTILSLFDSSLNLNVNICFN
jgi:hypothetical protein